MRLNPVAASPNVDIALIPTNIPAAQVTPATISISGEARTATDNTPIAAIIAPIEATVIQVAFQKVLQLQSAENPSASEYITGVM